MLRVGFVGVGFMGKGMVKSILKAKAKAYKGAKTKVVSIYDLNPANLEKLYSSISPEEKSLISVCGSPAEVAQNSDVVGLSLPSEAATEAVIFGENGLMTGFKPTTSDADRPIILDHGTFTRRFVLKISSRAQEKSVKYLDAPVHGGPVGADHAALTVMLGSDPESAARALPILNMYSKNVIHMGKIGAGMGAKLVCQAVVGMNAQAACEALILARKMGLTNSPTDAALLMEVIKGSWGQSKALELVFEDYISAQKGGWGEVMKSSAPLRNFHKDFTCLESEVPLVSMAVSTATASSSDLTTTVPIYVELTDSHEPPERPYGHAQTVGHARSVGHARTIGHTQTVAAAAAPADFPVGAEMLPSRALKRAAAAAAAMAAIPTGGPQAVGHRIGAAAAAAGEIKRNAAAAGASASASGPTLADLTSATPLYVDTDQHPGKAIKARHAASAASGSGAGSDHEARSLVRLPSLEATRNAIMKSMDAGYQDASIVSLIKILGK